MSAVKTGSAARKKSAGAAAEESQSGWRLLKHRDLRWLWAGQAVSQIGEGLNKVALLYLVYDLTHSTLKMTLIGVIQTVPPLIFGPILGVYIDRLPKKWVMIGADILRAGLALIIPLLYASGGIPLPIVYGVVFVMALVTAVFSPTLSATVPLIVSQKELTPANALIGSTAMIGMLIGPALSGVGIATVGIQTVLYASSGTFLLSVVSLSRLHLKRDQATSDTDRTRSFRREFKEGFRYVFVERRTVAFFVLAAGCYSLASAAFVFLLPVFAEKVLHVGPAMLGWLWSSYGAGMVAVTITLAAMRQPRSTVRLLLLAGALVAGGVASALLAGTTSPLPAIGLVALVGAGLAGFTPVAWGLLQELTPEEIRGRVFAIFNTGAMSSSVIGMVGFGWATDHLGTKWSFAGMAAILGTTAMICLGLSRLKDVKDLSAPQTGKEHAKRRGGRKESA